MAQSRSRARGKYTPLYLGHYVVPKYRYDSWNETCVDSLHRGPPYLSGGGLILQKSGVQWSPGAIQLTESDGSVSYSGLLTPNVTGYSGLDWSAPGSFQLDPSYYSNHASDGAVGWKRFKPGNPKAGLGQAFGEARKLPSIPRLREAVRSARKFGSEVLNLQFGWGPVLSDVRKAIQLAFRQEAALLRLKKYNGVWEKRGGTIATSKVTVDESTGTDSGFPIFTSSHYYYGGSNPGTYRTFLEMEERRWFEASFKYWIPDLGTYSGDRAALRALWGLNVTPGLLWELTPWSWLIDWFSNIGDVIDNVSLNAADNLVARWAYNMTYVNHTRRVNSTINIKQFDGSGGVWLEPVSCSVMRYRYAKLRNVANPFGFGVDFGSLSGRQMMILAALGLSRSPR